MQTIFVIATGGTIAGSAKNQTEFVNYQVGTHSVNDLLGGIPLPRDVNFAGDQLAQIDSKDMSFEVWRNLALKVQEALDRPDINGVVITHGTDTLEETAYFLHLSLNAHKPVVLTAAMRPASALSADGPANLSDAITLANCSDAKGVMCVLDSRIYSAFDIRKGHTYRLNAFNGGEAGAIGAIEGGVIRKWRAWQNSEPIISSLDLPEDSSQWPWVEIVTSCAGANGKIIPALVKAGINGIIIAATGNGTMHEVLIKQAQWAKTQGVRIKKAARVSDGVILGIDKNGFAIAKPSSPVKARILMIAQLLAKNSKNCS